MRRERALSIIAIPLALIALAGLFPRFWVFDLLNEFTLLWAWLTGIVLLVAILRRNRPVLFWSLLPAAIFGQHLLAALGTGPLKSVAASRLTITQANLLKLNANPEGLTYIQPDILILYEFVPEHEPLLKQFPALTFQHRVPYRMGLEQVILSRFPIEATRTAVPGAASWRVDVAGRKLCLFSIHPPIPGGASGHSERNRILNAFAREVGLSTGPRVIVGDFNATPFSAVSRTVEGLSGTRNSARGLGFFPTWPSFAPLLPLDHLLISGDISVLEKQTGSSIGSDHLPVTTEIAF